MLKSFDSNPANRESPHHEHTVRRSRKRNITPAGHITHLAERRLKASSYQQVRDVRCSWRDGALVLDGHVSSFYLKQIAQTTLRDLVERLPQVQRIDNRLEVY